MTNTIAGNNGGNFVIQGDICWSKGPASLETVPDAFLVCIEGKSAGVFPQLPQQYAPLPLLPCSGKLVIPGLVDLHTHAPQFAFRGLGMDLELLDWLNKHAFPEEAKYSDLGYARKAYGLFVEHLKRGPNTRIVIFATLHVPATLILMDMLEESGLASMVGKVNMDRNCPDSLREESAAVSLDATRKWLESTHGKYACTKPILTPRFIPSCSDELMRGLGTLRRELNLPVQSHLSESRREIDWVRGLCPPSDGYGAAYRDFDLFGSASHEDTSSAEGAPTVMAHCVWSDEKEITLMAGRGVFVAHCPQSNANLSSGIAPVRRMLNTGVSMGLGSDIAGGASCSIFRAMTDAIQASKLRRSLLGASPDEKALTLDEAFFLGTAGGGAFFGRAGMGYSGSFDPGCEFDALVLNDSPLAPTGLSIHDRLERAIYLCDDRHIEAKYVRGKLI
jgi:guanine deaminase